MPFHPTPELEHKLLCDLSDEQRTVSDVAGSNGIPLADFITWLASDRTQQRITEIERAFTARIRLTALGNLNFALRAAVDIITQLRHTSVLDSPSQREGAGGWADPRSGSPSLREGAGGRAMKLSPNHNTHPCSAPATPPPPSPHGRRTTTASGATFSGGVQPERLYYGNRPPPGPLPLGGGQER